MDGMLLFTRAPFFQDEPKWLLIRHHFPGFSEEEKQQFFDVMKKMERFLMRDLARGALTIEGFISGMSLLRDDPEQRAAFLDAASHATDFYMKVMDN